MKCIVTTYKQGVGVFEFEENRLVKAGIFNESQQICIGDIYLGRVDKILPNLNACFVKINGDTEVFLPFCETDLKIKCGDNILIQIKKEASKGKQPMGTTVLSLAGRYCVVSLEPHSIAISSKLDKVTREYWKTTLTEMISSEEISLEDKNILSKFCMIARTNITEAKDADVIKSEWISLASKLNFISEKGRYSTLFSKLHSENERYINAICHLNVDQTEEIVTDIPAVYDTLKERLGLQDELSHKLRLYQDDFPLQKVYSIQTHLDEACQKKVWLKCGGFLVIEPTEALTVIDVNSGKFEKKAVAEDYYKKVNVEAAVEIALQLKLRNISGIIIIDFINMQAEDNQKDILDLLAKQVARDTIKTYVVGMTSLGLVEVTRAKTLKPLEEQLNEINQS